MEVVETLKSRYCWAVMVASFVVGVLITRESLGAGLGLGKLAAVGMFLVLFPLSMACTIRLVKQKFREARAMGFGILNGLLYILGLLTVQACFAGGFCGVTFGTVLIATILPAGMAAAFIHNASFVLMAVDIALLAGLFAMGCFRRESKYAL